MKEPHLNILCLSIFYSLATTSIANIMVVSVLMSVPDWWRLFQGEVALVGVAADVWSQAPQRAAQAIDRLMALRLVSGGAIVTWVFGNPAVHSLDDEVATGTAWEVFYNAVNKMLARTQVGQQHTQFLSCCM